MKISNMFSSKSLSESCIQCGLHNKCVNPHVLVTGKGRLETLIIIEAPSMADDDNNEYLTGSWGNYLSKRLSELGVSLYNDFWITGSVQCSGGKKPPTTKQINLCHSNLMDTIEKLNPRFIWTMGNVPSKSILGKGLKRISISSLNGRTIPIHDLDAWCIPMISTATVCNRKHDTNLKNYYIRTLKSALSFMREDKELPIVNPFDGIQFLRTPEAISYLISEIGTKDLISAFDFEATGIDPWRPGHFITSMAIATTEKSYAFAVDHPDSKYSVDDREYVHELICEYLENKDIVKVGHNVNFDKMWGYWISEANPEGEFRCTMNTSHILDNRMGNNGLKDQAFIRWGIVNYDKDTEPYIKSVPGTHFNRMMEMDLDKQLTYVGADSKLTLRLFEEQQEELTDGQQMADRFFINALESLGDLQNNGFICDHDYYSDVNGDLSTKIMDLTDEINNSKDAKEYEARYKEEFKYSSPVVLKRLLFEMKGVEAVKFTDKGNKSVDEEALSKIDYWMCEKIVELRKIEKLRNTFIKQYLQGINGKVHPTFQLNTVASYRSSCKNPNIQNTPKRNAYAKNLIRKGMKPPKGWKMFEIDVRGCEVSTSAMYHKDPTFMKYLTTPGTDMHRDNTCDIWKCDPEQVTKMMRFFGKNMWTFAQFYGDYFGSCGPNMWNTCLFEENLIMADGTPLKDHIFDKGITELGEIVKGHCTPGSFLEHCQSVEDKMWNERFPVYTQWKKDVNDFYNDHGYVETFLGFRYTGYLDSKQTTNYPVQGTAFHLLMWALHESNKRLKEERWYSYLVGEVHDSMIGYVHPDEEKELFPMIKKICSVELPKRFDFVNVPFEIEIEVSETNGNFAELTEIEI